MATEDTDPDMTRAETTLAMYAGPLLRRIAAMLLKPRSPIPEEELIERCLSTLMNPPVVDRRLRDLPDAARKILAIMGLSRQSSWKLGHLLTILATMGHAEGLAPIHTLLEYGLLLPVLPTNTPTIASFEEILTRSGVLEQELFSLSAVAARAREESLGFPDLSDPRVSELGATLRIADGLEWPLRIAAVSQIVAESPFRLTMARALFKRDLTRLQTNELQASAPADHLLLVPDPGTLCFYWAEAISMFRWENGELHSRNSVVPAANAFDDLVQLTAALSRLESWDPERGYLLVEEGNLSPFPTASFAVFFLLGSASGWVTAQSIADYLWEHHPSWQGVLKKESAQQHGKTWIEAFLFGVAYPLRLIEVLDGETRVARLSDLGKHLFAGGPAPQPIPAFPQTLMVQPNAEILAYRQGLTPPLIAKLTRCARWKAIGPACTLELTPEQTYIGLESGLTLSGIIQTLNQHGTRPVPLAVVDLLQRWANKRERITVYSSATLVEFQSTADLDQAIARGIVALRITDRMGICSDGGDPDFKNLRLLGNRDYEARPTKCLSIDDDGITLTVDTAGADLLLEADIGQLAESITDDPPGLRRYTLQPVLLKKAIASNWTLEDLDAWFIARAGTPLPAAAKLFVLAAQAPRVEARSRMILSVPSTEIADGLMQWPSTLEFIEERIGPRAVALSEENWPALRDLLLQLGIICD